MKPLLILRRIVFFLFVFTICRAEAQTSGYSGTGANIDVIYQKCNWRINPDSVKPATTTPVKAIGGSVSMRFTTKSNVTKVTFDLSSAMTISKIVFRGANLPAANITRSGNVVTVTLGVTLPNNYTDEIDIFYNGTPPAFSTYGEGFEKTSITGMGNVVYTLAESYGDDDWWPCKADMQDKIEAMDIIISMPSAFKAASNGILVKDEVIGAQRVMTYKSSYPIASYLVAVGVAKYNVFNRPPVVINGTSVPIVYYIYSGRGANPTTQLTAMDFCRDELLAFSNKFGDYPFKNEKYGMYEFGWGGGMEHQTFSAMGWSTMSSWSVIAHELAHQWFGDKVTFATWHHLWLAEGFAKYSEVLAAELVKSMGKDHVAHRSGIKDLALSTATTSVYLSQANIANSNTIWTTANDNALYQRGAMVVSMLRKLAGDDLFFKALKNYLADPALAYKSATTENLRDHFEAVLGYDLDAFFTDYIYGTGNPAYDINWGSTGGNINIELTTQRRSTSSTVPYFRTPVVLKITNGLASTNSNYKDTTVVIYDENGKVSYAGNDIQQSNLGKTLGYKLSFVPTTVTIDPNSETLVRGQDATTAKSTVTKPTNGRLNYAPTILYVPMQVMPVNIIDFKGVKTTYSNQLSLLIEQTYEKTSIVAERSENGSSFTAIGEMVNSGSSGKGMLYLLEDKTFFNAHSYFYRVKTVDEAGIVKYSKVISLQNNLKATDGVTINPNPVIDHINVFLSKGWEHGRISITVFNNAGMAVKNERFNAASKLQIPVHHLPSGNYSLEVVQQGGKTINKQFIIVR